MPLAVTYDKPQTQGQSHLAHHRAGMSSQLHMETSLSFFGAMHVGKSAADLSDAARHFPGNDLSRLPCDLV